MRPCPRCSIPMRAEVRTFAKIDVCPRCGGAFFDPGEGVAVHGADAEPRFLVEDGRATKRRTSDRLCPAHETEEGGSYRDRPSAAPAASAPRMDVYGVGGEGGVEIDYCPACGGFFLDAGEDAALLELARAAETSFTTTTGATFAVLPGAAAEATIAAARATRGKSAFGEMMRGILDALVDRERRRRHRIR